MRKPPSVFAWRLFFCAQLRSKEIDNKKSESRENDEFVGFLHLHIPRNWEFTSSLIRSFEELLKELKIKQKIYYAGTSG